MTDLQLDELLDAWETPDPSPSLRRACLPGPSQRGQRRWLWLAASAFLACAVVVGFRVLGIGMLGQSAGEAAPGLHLRVTTSMEPAMQQVVWFRRIGTAGSMGRGKLVRFCYDRVSRSYSGYQLNFAPLGDGLWSMAASLPDAHFREFTRIEEVSSYRHIPAALPPARTMRDGDSVEIELLDGISDSANFRDTVEISAAALALTPAPNSPSREKSEMNLSEPRLEIDGSPIYENRNGYIGQSFQIVSSVEGRYILAVDPKGNPKFVEAGFVDGQAMEFRAGSRVFRITASKLIASGGRRPLYLLHQPAAHRSASASEEFDVASSGPASLF